MTVEGYVYFWLAILGGSLAIACAMAWWLVRQIVLELARLGVEMAAIRERIAMRNLAESSTALRKELRKAKR